jgi:hypothetical protein
MTTISWFSALPSSPCAAWNLLEGGWVVQRLGRDLIDVALARARITLVSVSCSKAAFP